MKATSSTSKHPWPSSQQSNRKISQHGPQPSVKPTSLKTTPVTTHLTASHNTPVPLTPAIKYAGCHQYSTNYIPTMNSDKMDYEICFARCTFYRYVALFDQECFCAKGLDSTNLQFPDSDCNLPCPGNESEKCGGSATRGRTQKREENWKSLADKHGLLISTFELPVIAAEEPCPDDIHQDEPPPQPHTTILHSVIPAATLTPTIRFAGCFLLPYSSRDFILREISNKMTWDVCFSRCKADGYAGLYDDSCFCARILDDNRYPKFAKEDCSLPCPGDKTETCGGILENQPKATILTSVFEIPAGAVVAAEAPPPSTIHNISPPPPSPTLGSLQPQYRYDGCVGSSNGFTGFTLHYYGPMTIEICAELCKGSFLIATYESNCYCAPILQGASLFGLADSYCNSPCPGNPKESCGGPQGPPGDHLMPEYVVSLYFNIDLAGENPQLGIPPLDAGSPQTPQYKYRGCVGSQNGLASFFLRISNVDLEKCIKLCEGAHFIGIFFTSCYCSDKPEDSVLVVVQESFCNYPCLLHRSEMCGGKSGPPEDHLNPTFVLSFYAADMIGENHLGPSAF